MKDKDLTTVEAKIEKKIMYLNAKRDQFLPRYVYYMLQAYKCEGVKFADNKRTYTLDELKELKNNWEGR